MVRQKVKPAITDRNQFELKKKGNTASIVHKCNPAQVNAQYLVSIEKKKIVEKKNEKFGSWQSSQVCNEWPKFTRYCYAHN